MSEIHKKSYELLCLMREQEESSSFLQSETQTIAQKLGMPERAEKISALAKEIQNLEKLSLADEASKAPRKRGLIARILDK